MLLLQDDPPTERQEVQFLCDAAPFSGRTKPRSKLVGRPSDEPTGGSGDGGIDGVISLDRLGLERVYVQAKRYAEGNTVGRPAIQAFLGAITMKNASKGVFITSSAFSREAKDYVSERDGIVLIDGDELAELMMDYGVGTRRTGSLHLVEVDDAFFENGH